MLWLHFFFSKKIEADKAVVIERDISPTETTSYIEPVVAPPLPRQEPKMVVLSEGMTLRLLALDLWGSREFWVYIYLENKDVIPDPNRVLSGTKLIVPQESAYPINAADPNSVAKAKSLGNELLSRFK